MSQSSINSNSQSPKPNNDLPDKPIVVIEPSRHSLAVNLHDIWQFRDLLYILTLRDIKVRYKQTVLGILWVIIQPLFMMIVFTLFFGRLAQGLFKVGKNTFLPQIYTDKHEIKKQIKIKLLLYLHYYQSSSV